MGKIALLYLLLSSVFSGENIPKMGEGVLSYLFWDVYKVEYFKSNENNYEKLIITYNMNLTQKDLLKGWDYGLKNNLGRDLDNFSKQISWIKDMTPKVEKNDIFEITKNGDLVSIFHNGKKLGENKDKKLARIVLLPWIGNEPVDLDLKKDLLGN